MTKNLDSHPTQSNTVVSHELDNLQSKTDSREAHTAETKPFSTEWDTNHEGYRAIFNAALAGITANPNFFGFTMQQRPDAAVEFANEVVLAAIHGKNYVPVHAREGWGS